MFTGIVEGMAEVERIARRAGGASIYVRLGALAEGVRTGDSIAVSGCCLTVTGLEGDLASFDAVPETLDRTRFSVLAAGSRVNIERSLRLGDRLGGHLVQGHVDGVARCTGRRAEGDQVRFDFEGSERLTAEMVTKGSIAIDGVSLTLIEVGTRAFAAAIIPHTLAVTTFGALAPGEPVNIETDVFGKWVRKAIEPYLSQLQQPSK